MIRLLTFIIFGASLAGMILIDFKHWSMGVFMLLFIISGITWAFWDIGKQSKEEGK